MSSPNAERAREIFEALWSRHEVDRIDELCAPDVKIHDPFHGLLDRTGFRELLISRTSAMPQHLFIEVEEALEADGHVVIRWTGSGRGDGEPLDVTGISLLTLRDGRLAEQWSAWDTERFGEAIGLLPHGTGAVLAFDRETPPA